jgi:predicted nucleotidyltransferase
MNENIKSELDRIVTTLAATGLVTKVILFGSYARGEETPDSDIDLCVLTPVTDRRPLDVGVELRVKLIDVQETDLDLIPFNQDEFSARAKCPGTFQNDIMKHGVVLYE